MEQKLFWLASAELLRSVKLCNCAFNDTKFNLIFTFGEKFLLSFRRCEYNCIFKNKTNRRHNCRSNHRTASTNVSVWSDSSHRRRTNIRSQSQVKPNWISCFFFYSEVISFSLFSNWLRSSSLIELNVLCECLLLWDNRDVNPLKTAEKEARLCGNKECVIVDWTDVGCGRRAKK